MCCGAQKKCFLYNFDFFLSSKLASNAPTTTNHSTGSSNCDRWITYSGKGTIKTPVDNNGLYPDSTRCIWRIFGPVGSFFKLHFNSFSTEKSHECQYDGVMIYDGPSAGNDVISTLCGAKHPRDEYSKSNEVMIVFYADKAYDYAGIVATYEMITTRRKYSGYRKKTTVEPRFDQVEGIHYVEFKRSLTADGMPYISDMSSWANTYPKY